MKQEFSTVWGAHDTLRSAASLLILVLMMGVQTELHAGEWNNAAAMNSPRIGAASAVHGGLIYAFGGLSLNGQILNTVETYDALQDSWDDASVSPFEVPRSNAVAVVKDGLIYLIGGETAGGIVSDVVEVYHPGQDEWTMETPLNFARSGHAGGVVNGSICILAGIGGNGKLVSKIEFLQGSTGKWLVSPTSLGQPRVAPFAKTVDDTFYIMGGFQSVPMAGGAMGTVVDPDWSMEWQGMPSLQLKRGYGATAHLFGRIHVVGGNTLDGATGNMEVFSLAGGSYSEGPPMPTPRIGCSAATVGEKIFVFGGYRDSPTVPLDIVEVYAENTIFAGYGPQPELPDQYILMNGYPNPFNGTMQIEIMLPARDFVQLAVYDVQGRSVRTLHDGRLAAGRHQFSWAARNDEDRIVSSGIYLAVLQGQGYTQAIKVAYVR